MTLLLLIIAVFVLHRLYRTGRLAALLVLPRLPRPDGRTWTAAVLTGLAVALYRELPGAGVAPAVVAGVLVLAALGGFAVVLTTYAP